MVLALGSANIPEELIEKTASVVEAKDHSIDRALANSAYDFLSKYTSDRNGSLNSAILLSKTAGTKDEDWSAHDDEVVDCITKVAAPLIPLVGAGLGASAALAGVGSNLAMKAVPAIGEATGGTVAEAERLVSEDDLTTEQLKAQIIKYRILTAQLDKELNRRFLKKDKEALFEE